MLQQIGEMSKTDRMTVMMGGATNPEVAGMSKEELTETAFNRVSKILDIDRSIKPVVTYADVARQCIPQYPVGHSDNMDAMKRCNHSQCPFSPVLIYSLIHHFSDSPPLITSPLL